MVMHAEAGGTMVHEACGHGLEADLVQKGLSVYKDKMGEQVAIPELSVIDDAAIKGKYGSFRFDDEGSPAKRTVLIDKGILKTFLNDRLTAARDSTELTGNGRRESYQNKPIPRMSNTLIAPGKDDSEELSRVQPGFTGIRKWVADRSILQMGIFVFEFRKVYH